MLHKEFTASHGQSSDEGGGSGDNGYSFPSSSQLAHHSGKSEDSNAQNKPRAPSQFGRLQNLAMIENRSSRHAACGPGDEGVEFSSDRTLCANIPSLPASHEPVTRAHTSSINVRSPESSQGGVVLGENLNTAFRGHPGNQMNDKETVLVESDAIPLATVTATSTGDGSHSSVDNTGLQSGGSDYSSDSQEEIANDLGDEDEERDLSSADTERILDYMSEPEDHSEC